MENTDDKLVVLARRMNSRGRLFDTEQGRDFKYVQGETVQAPRFLQPGQAELSGGVTLLSVPSQFPNCSDGRYSGMEVEKDGQRFVIDYAEPSRFVGPGGRVRRATAVHLVVFHAPSDTLRQRRALQLRLMDKSCDVLRDLPATDPLGRPGKGAEAVAGTYPCKVLAARRPDHEEVSSDRPVGLGERIVHLPYDADVQDTDRLRVFDLADGVRIGAGRLYDVLGAEGGLSDAETLPVNVKAKG